MTENIDKLIENADKYSDFIKVSLKDLVKLTNGNKEVFLDLYYNRTTEFIEMQSILKNIRNRGDNILIIGFAGAGKSSFMYKVFYEIENLPSYLLHPIIVDFREVSSKEELFKNFISKMEIYFDKIECSINTLKTNNNENLTQNLFSLREHLANLNEKDFTKHLVILLDDFDYIEQDELFDVLEVFASFGVHKNVTLVLSTRPALYASIKEYDNRLEKTFTRDIHRINLARLDIKKLLSKRLGLLILENKGASGLNYWWNKITQKESTYIQLLRKMGIEEPDNIEKINIPFTGLYLNFIRCITNHNNREIFDIVHDSMIFVVKNYNKLEDRDERNEDGSTITVKIIEEEHILQLFYDSEDALFKIININKYKSKKGNSLFFNTLEAVKHFGRVNDTYIEKMKLLGHSEKDIEYAIERLKHKHNPLISPTKIIPTKIIQRVDRYPEYRITKKGDFYLTNMAYWDSYIGRCGHFGETLTKLL